MLCNLNSLGLHGVTGHLVPAECGLSDGLPGAAVKEARERARPVLYWRRSSRRRYFT